MTQNDTKFMDSAMALAETLHFKGREEAAYHSATIDQEHTGTGRYSRYSPVRPRPQNSDTERCGPGLLTTGEAIHHVRGESVPSSQGSCA